MIWGIGRPFLTASAVNVFLLLLLMVITIVDFIKSHNSTLKEELLVRQLLISSFRIKYRSHWATFPRMNCAIFFSLRWILVFSKVPFTVSDFPRTSLFLDDAQFKFSDRPNQRIYCKCNGPFFLLACKRVLQMDTEASFPSDERNNATVTFI